MQIDREALRQHYREFTDEELLALNPEELTDLARKCRDAEIDRRNLTEAEGEPPIGDAFQPLGHCDGLGSGPEIPLDADAEGEPPWLDTAACVLSYVSFPGNEKAADAADAREALLESGVPCHLSVHELDEEAADNLPRPQVEYRLMVPGALSLQATAELDKAVFNPEIEADWRTHLARLSDSELGALDVDKICSGFLDRAARLKRAYQDEVARRT